MRLQVEFVGTVKNVALFIFCIYEYNKKKRATCDIKFVTRFYGIRGNFQCYAKYGISEMKVSVLRNEIGKCQSAKISRNLPLPMNQDYVYESTSGDLGHRNTKKLSTSDNCKNIGQDDLNLL